MRISQYTINLLSVLSDLYKAGGKYIGLFKERNSLRKLIGAKETTNLALVVQLVQEVMMRLLQM
jgi:hypothetical protein